MVYQDIRRAIILPSYAYSVSDNSEEVQKTTQRNLGQLAENYSRLAREVVDCHNQILVYQKAIAGAAATYALTLESPYYDVNWSASVLPSWNTATWFTAKTRFGITFNFAIAAPGGGGTLLIWTVR